MRTLSVSQVLTGAKSLLVTKGWTTGNMWNADGFCIVGAIRYAAAEHCGESMLAIKVMPLLVAGLRQRGVAIALREDTLSREDTLTAVTGWNDRTCRDVADAVALIDEVLLMITPADRSPMSVRLPWRPRRKNVPVVESAPERELQSVS